MESGELGTQKDKAARLQLIYERLQAAPAASTRKEIYALFCETIQTIEDEHSGVPNKPENWKVDGRLYPPRADWSYSVDGFPDVVRYRSFGHNTFVASNGAIEVQRVASSKVDFSKAGANGKGVWE